MCVPAAAAVPMMFATTAVSTGLSIYGQQQQAKSQRASLKYQSQVAQLNAQQADEAAADAIERGEEDALAHGREVAAVRGAQTTSYASMGLELDYGTPAAIAEDLDVLSAEDAARIRRNAEREGRGYSIQAGNYRAESQGALMARSAVKQSAFLNSASTLIGGASQWAGLTNKYGDPFQRKAR